jgi:hypothetical protein
LLQQKLEPLQRLWPTIGFVEFWDLVPPEHLERVRVDILQLSRDLVGTGTAGGPVRPCLDELHVLRGGRVRPCYCGKGGAEINTWKRTSASAASWWQGKNVPTTNRGFLDGSVLATMACRWVWYSNVCDFDVCWRVLTIARTRKQTVRDAG